ncbi:MAG: Do family serine endopeptidase [Beijerinckiaceae bacterium]|nr:Do family serine endopeptidase [Beijerinckiaceae bacterium]
MFRVSALNPTTARKRSFSGAAVILLSAGLLAASPLAGIAPAFAKGQQESLAPLVEQVIDAVVNIKASQTTEAKGVPLPRLPGAPRGPQGGEGSPLDEFFNDFFNQNGGEGRPQPRQRRGTSLGSGFVIDSSGIVVTNNHVIADANEIFVVLNDGTEIKAELVGKDPKVDLAVLRVKTDRPLKSVKFGDSTQSRIGDSVIAIGNPFGFGGSVSAGIISAINRNIGSGSYDNYIQTDASINKGNSGGPLFNMDGDVIGINTAIISPSGGSIGIGFAVPSRTAMPIVDQLVKYGETRRGWLGVKIQDVDEGIAESLDLGKVRGAFVGGVDEKGPAKTAGIEEKDVILKFDGKDIRSSRDLPRIVAETPVGKEVEVTLFRKGKELVKTVKLGRLEEGEKKQNASLKSNGKDTPDVSKKVLGLDITSLTSEARKRFNVKDGIKGVLIARVDPDSKAAERRLQPGDVIVEVSQEAVADPSDVTARLDKLKASGKKVALLAVTSAQGDLRYVALPIE